MLQLYRILNGIDSLCIENFVELDLGGRTRGHCYKLFKSRVKTREKRNTLGFRAMNEVVDAENLNQFKTRLEIEWNDKEYKFDPSSYY